MLVYLGLIAVLLIVNEEKRINNYTPIVTNETVIYRDSSFNKINVTSYCKNKTCVLKCCPNGEELDSKEICRSSAYNKQSSGGINFYVVRADNWYKANASEEMIKNYDTSFAQNKSVTETAGENVWLFDYYVLKDGSIRIKNQVDNATKTVEWEGAPPLTYCINNNLAEVLGEQVKLTLIFKHAADKEGHTGPRAFIFAFVGLIAALLLFGFCVYRLSPVFLRVMRLVMLAYMFTIIAAFVTIMVQLLLLNAQSINTTECRILSPFTFFFVLSSFFWVNIVVYDSFCKIRKFKKRSITIDRDADRDKFIRWCMLGWVTPLLMTLSAVVVNLVKLDAILYSIKTPFDTCLGNEHSMYLYMHLPVTILTALSGLFFLMKLYSIWTIQRGCDDVVDLVNNLISKHRFGARIKIWTIISVSGFLELCNAPRLIYYTIHGYNIIIGTAIFTLFVYERCVYGLPYISYNVSEEYTDFTRKISGALTVRTTVPDVVNERNNNASRGSINMSTPITPTIADSNRY